MEENDIDWLLVLIIPGVLLVMQLVVGGLLTWLIAIYKSGRVEALDRRRAQDEKIEAIKDDFHAFKAALPQQYVLRDDFIRVMTGFDAKLDRLAELIGLHRRDP
jgi:hypothetical protein